VERTVRHAQLPIWVIDAEEFGASAWFRQLGPIVTEAVLFGPTRIPSPRLSPLGVVMGV
jgi:hypothetical protein